MIHNFTRRHHVTCKCYKIYEKSSILERSGQDQPKIPDHGSLLEPSSSSFYEAMLRNHNYHRIGLTFLAYLIVFNL